MQLSKLTQTLADLHEPAFRLAQIKRAFYVEYRESWEDVSVLSKPLRATLAEAVPWNALELVRKQEGDEGETVKALFACADGQKIEAVLMCHEDERNTVCISSQVGCAMGCTFCATGTMGWIRNLTRDEIVEQVIYFARMLAEKEDRVTNVVFMGMGEPFNNYEEVMAAVRMLNDPTLFGLGARHISISTCGIVPGILRLAEEGIQVNLAISLHSGMDTVRSKMMPVNKAYPLEKLMDAVRIYMEKTNRKVMFEYLLLSGVNDRPEDARALKKLFGDNVRLVHVNLIKYHNTHLCVGTPLDRREAFLAELHDLGIPATHRVTFGEEIDAACGQLAVKEA
ncbi:23S rRNA (adenine(2503)-C(2))-methyltransferase RlmN [Patescibacteria group bacterium]|nr:23S rRNA (adenine(2503)-C(2))-methyltransferase RlmN [Patescibacteria group bacterium]